MTTQSILVLVGIVSVFATFGIVLAWADFYSQGRPKPTTKNRRRQRIAPGTCSTTGVLRDGKLLLRTSS